MNSHSEDLFSVSYILHILTYSYVLSILSTEYIQTDWFGFIHKTVYTPRGTRPRRMTESDSVRSVLATGQIQGGGPVETKYRLGRCIFFNHTIELNTAFT